MAYYDQEAVPLSVVVSGVWIDSVEPSNIPFRGKFTVSGHIQDRSVGYKSVQIYLKDRWGESAWYLGSAVTDLDGNFSQEFTLPSDVAEPGRYYLYARYIDSVGDEVYSDDYEVCVCYQTQIELGVDPAPPVPVGTTATIGGQLKLVMPDGTAKGFAGALVDVYVFLEDPDTGEWVLQKKYAGIQADDLGYFRVQHTFDQEGLYHVEAAYYGFCSTLGTDCKLGSTVTVDVDVLLLELTIRADKSALRLGDTINVTIASNTERMENVDLVLVWFDEAGNEQRRTLRLVDITDYSATVSIKAEELASSILGRDGYLVAVKGEVQSNTWAIALVAPTRITLDQARISVRPGESFQVSGAIEYMSDYYAGAGTWSPLPDVVVKGLWSDLAKQRGAQDSQARSDSNGRFAFTVKAPDVGGSYTLNVVFEGTVPSGGVGQAVGMPSLYLEPTKVTLTVRAGEGGEEEANWLVWALAAIIILALIYIILR